MSSKRSLGRDTLIKPSWTPSNALFGPVWSILYFLMALSIYSISTLEVSLRKKRVCYALFLLQLVFNGIWAPLFFGMGSIFLGLLDILFLFVLFIFTLIRFYEVHPLSAILLVPYLLWTAFALLLNMAVFYLS